MAEKARANVATIDWSNIRANLLVTVSAGVASTAEIDEADGLGAALLKLVDGRLYRAKREGRNRIVAS